MPTTQDRIFITGASGQLGRLILQSLTRLVSPSRIVAGVRSAKAAESLAEFGVETREADYSRPETLRAAFAGIDRLLLISSSELGGRLDQHLAVIHAAKAAGVGLVVYTSLLHAKSSPLALHHDHLETEKALAASGLPHIVLRNGWYTENYLASVPAALEHGKLFGAAAEGRISSAARIDYAEAAAGVLAAAEPEVGAIYELAGDESYSLAEFAAALSRVAGKNVVYQNLPEAEFRALLIQVGLPEPFADLLANSDAGAAQGGLFDDSHTLSRLIGRPTTSLVASLATALGG